MIGKQDFAEGGYYPLGLHWGFIKQYGGLPVRIESYICLNLFLPWKKEIPAPWIDADVMVIGRLRLLVFFAWPRKSFPEGRPRYRLAVAWVPKR